MNDEILAAIAARMNLLEEVTWDRCVAREHHAGVYGWIARDDGRSDFVVLDFQWGETQNIDGEPFTWFGVGFTTSSAKHSEAIQARLMGEEMEHIPCRRVADVFGARVARVNWGGEASRDA